MNSVTKQPFYINEEVIAVDAMKGSCIKNGLIYTVYSCHCRWCKDGYYWYVGVICHVDGYKSHNSLRPSIFRSLDIITEYSYLEEVLQN